MEIRSYKNWQSKSGGWDTLNLKYIDFDCPYPVLSSIFDINDYQIVMCNNYKSISVNSMISMFIDDYVLERYWNNPLKYIPYFKKAKYIMSPDFSLLIDMPLPLQMYNVYRNRLIGYLWQKKGLNIIPTISWSNIKSFDFCFKGVKKNSNVCISNIGCRNEINKYFFDLGFNEMKKRLKPKNIIFQCNKKYKEFYTDENIIFIDSFWDNKRKIL